LTVEEELNYVHVVFRRIVPSSNIAMQTRADTLRFAIAFALRGARKLVRGLRQGLSEEERYRVADDVVQRLQQHGDPWRLNENLPDVTGKSHST
jgi:hypothetical protein